MRNSTDLLYFSHYSVNTALSVGSCLCRVILRYHLDTPAGLSAFGARYSQSAYWHITRFASQALVRCAVAMRASEQEQETRQAFQRRTESQSAFTALSAFSTAATAEGR